MSRTALLSATFFLTAAATLCADPAAELVLAAVGATEYQIVLPDAFPTPEIGHWLTNAAVVAQTAFRTNGFEIALVAESGRDPAKPGIFLGDTVFARAQGLNAGALEGWTHVHKVVGRDLILAGRDRPWQATPPEGGWRGVEGHPRLGTVKAVTAFLHDYAGVRFLYPTPTGIEYLPLARIAVPADLDRTLTPMVQFNYGGYTSRDLYAIANNSFFPVDGEVGVHTWPRAIPTETYREKHPEYFALVNGKRDSTGQYCISNPDVRELIYQDMLDHADRGYQMVGLGQPDGFRPCQCEACHKLYGTGDDWGEKIWILHRELAERLLKDRPDRKVVIISYGHTWAPPKTFKEFPENVIVMWCRMSPELMEQWSACSVPGGHIGYLYIWGTYNLLAYTAQRTPAEIASLVAKFHDLGLSGLFLDGSETAYGMEGPNYYLFGRLLDDPENLQARDILEEFYEAAFREAATPMRRFYDTLYHAIQFSCDMPYSYEDVYGRKRPFFRTHDHKMKLMAFLYAPDVLAELETHLSQAESRAASPKVKARLSLVRLEFDYAHRIATVAHLHNAYRIAPDPAAYERLLTAVDEWNAFLAPLYNWWEERNIWRPGMRRGVLPAWPDMNPFRGHSHHAVALTRFYAETPLNWNTAELREVARSEAGQSASGTGSDSASRMADEQDRGAFGAPVGGTTPDSPVRRVRVQLYETTFELPPAWNALRNVLPPEAWAPWRFREDPANQGVEAGWPHPDWNTADWTPIAVPAFWAETDVGDYQGFGWYRTTFTVPEAWEGKPVRLLFGSVDEQAWVYVNGHLVREHTTASENATFDTLWEAPFTADIPPALLRHDAPNSLAVRVHNRLGNGGIWRPVLAQIVQE